MLFFFLFGHYFVATRSMLKGTGIRVFDKATARSTTKICTVFDQRIATANFTNRAAIIG